MEQEQFSSNAMAEWRAEQARLIAEKDAAEQRELQVIREEAQAERELMYSQREKQLDAAFKTNRERQESVVQDMELKGWEAVVNLSSDSNLVPGSTADLAKYKALLTRLKHKEPEAFSAAV
jgi:flagellar biosynthesis component FlhA